MYFDELKQSGNLKRTIDALKYGTSLMIQGRDNLKLFNFFNETDITCDLNNYKDTGHYSEMINSKIIHFIAQEKDLLTEENYSASWDYIYDFYNSYDYDSLIQSISSD